MDLLDLQALDTEAAAEVLRKHADTDPGKFALQYKGDLSGASLATQLKHRKRAKAKLPSWWAAECLYTGRALEQASSEMACEMKFEGCAGDLAVDLTGGLGVDVWAMAQKYERVIYVDADEILCAMAQVNFGRLGLENVEVVHARAEDFVGKYAGPPVDLVYADPDRRDARGLRQTLLQDCAPNVLELLPNIQQRMGSGAKVMVKASPMLDIAAMDDELEGEKRLVVASIGNEVKELLAVLGEGENGVEIRVERGNGWEIFKGEIGESEIREGVFPDQEGTFLYEPDAAFYKARQLRNYFAKMPDLDGGMNFADGYYFSPHLHKPFPGRIFEILEIHPYKPKALKKRLKNLGLPRLLLSRRHFDLPLHEVKQKLGLKTGGDTYLLLTRRPSGERMALLAKRLH